MRAITIFILAFAFSFPQIGKGQIRAVSNAYKVSPQLPTDPHTDKVTYEDQVDASHFLTKKDIFVTGKRWANDHFKSEDEESIMLAYSPKTGKFVCEGHVKIDSDSKNMNLETGKILPMQAGRVVFTLTFEAKDHSYHYQFTDFYHDATISGGSLDYARPECGAISMSTATWNRIKKQFKQKMEKLILNLDDAIEVR